MPQQNYNPSPWYYVPTAYFLEGLPYALINILAGIIYVKMDIPIAKYTFWTGLFGLPWVVKMFWAPLIDGNKTKRWWVILTQYLMGLAFVAAALSLGRGDFFTISAICFFAGAFLSATHDIALDGYYMIALDAKKQSLFVGVRTTVYRLAMLFTSGPLVILAGYIEKSGGSIARSWTIALLIAAAIILAFNTYHFFIMPRPMQDAPQKSKDIPLYFDTFKKFLTQQGFWFIVIFMLFFRIGDALLSKLLVPFLLRAPETGALGISTASYGLIKGTLGVFAVISGNLLGGFLLSKYGFKKCIWWFAAVLVLPNFLYAYMAANPQAMTLPMIGSFIVFEHLGDGIGFMAITVFMLIIARGAYKTSFYAIGTGLMAFGTMIPPIISGKLFEMLGSNYAQYFMITAIISLVAFLIVPLILRVEKVKESDAEILKKNKEFISQN